MPKKAAAKKAKTDNKSKATAKPKVEKAQKVVKPPKEVKEPKVIKEKEPKAPKPPKEPKPPRITKAQAAIDKTAAEDSKKWIDLKAKYGQEKAPAYSMSAAFEANQPIQHKVLGWGYILSVQNDRLEVLFEQGPKILISNYKSK